MLDAAHADNAAVKLSDPAKPRMMKEVGRCYKRLGEAFQSFAQQLTFALLQEPNDASKKEISPKST